MLILKIHFFLQLSVEKNGLAILASKNIGINSEPNQYYKNILREDEIRHIKNRINEIDKIINDQKSFEINFKDLDDKYFLI